MQRFRFAMAKLGAAVTVLACSSWSVEAGAQCIAGRPTDEGGFLSWDYADAAVSSFATPQGNIRVWYAEDGVHAVDLAATMGGVPDSVALVGAITEEALEGFVDMGFAPPIADGPSCASYGGDSRLDVYMMHFPAADGSAVPSMCFDGVTTVCSGYFILENDFAGGGYPSFEAAVRTVAPHELFHLIQDGYDVDLSRWFAEGSAQWATDRLTPSLTDLESFLPAYFSEIHRSIDAPPGGVTNAFLYGTAIWPVYLDEQVGSAVTLEALTDLHASGGTILDALERVVVTYETTLGREFTRFGAFNAATGDRGSRGSGYTQAASYPMLDVTPSLLDPDNSISGVLSGLGLHYYQVELTEPLELTLDADPAQVGAMLVPITAGGLDLASTTPPPVVYQGAAIVVVGGQSASKVDAPYEIIAKPAPEETVQPSPETPSDTRPIDDAIKPADGCSCRLSGPTSPPRYHWALLGLSLLTVGLRARRKDVGALVS